MGVSVGNVKAKKGYKLKILVILKKPWLGDVRLMTGEFRNRYFNFEYER